MSEDKIVWSGIQIFGVVQKDAEAKGLKKGSGGRGTCTCPCGGTISYSVASCNGHVHLRCDKCGTAIMQ